MSNRHGGGTRHNGILAAARDGAGGGARTGKSTHIDEIKKRGVLRAAAIGEFPWLPENTTRQRAAVLRPGLDAGQRDTPSASA